MRLQSAIFDMDGTLLDSMHIWHNLGTYVLQQLGYDPGPELQEKLKVLSLRDGAAYCRETYHMPQSQEELVGLLEARVKDYYYNHATLKPGVEKALSILKMEGVWMYIATATDRHLTEAALRHTGIDGYFRGILTCAEAGAGKDNPKIFEYAMKRLRSTKRDTVIFEDALHAIRTAKAAGFRVAAIYDPCAEEDQEEIRSLADYYFRSFEELFETTTLN